VTDPATAADPAGRPVDDVRRGGALEVLAVATRLGLTSFGGPTAHIGYFREEYVRRRRWLDDDVFGELVALCQFLPGPASSQLGVAVGMRRAGALGGLAAFVGFTWPSAVAMVLFAYGIGEVDGREGWVRGLGLAAVAVVALAVWTMWRSLVTGRLGATLAVASAVLVLTWDSSLARRSPWRPALRSRAGRPPQPCPAQARPRRRVRPRAATLLAPVLFVALLVGLPLARAAGAGPAVETADAFYRSGALVFGGGHVVLPLLERETVDRGWLSEEAFLAGYGAAQAVPGPLFTFAAYLGAERESAPNGVAGAALALGRRLPARDAAARRGAAALGAPPRPGRAHARRCAGRAPRGRHPARRAVRPGPHGRASRARTTRRWWPWRCSRWAPGVRRPGWWWPAAPPRGAALG
jgi:chromate transporter